MKIIKTINESRGSYEFLSFRMIFLLLLLFVPNQEAKSEKLFLKCIGKYEINRGELIKPDWETSYLTIDLVGLKSGINDKGVKKEGGTLIRGNSYAITHRDNNNRIKTKYLINETHGTFFVDYPQRNRSLLGTCEKGRG